MVIFSSRSPASFWPRPSAVSAISAAETITKVRAASPTYPIPVARPMAIPRNSTPISRAVPGAERKRTRLKAPATATPAPMLPFTSMMTTCTTMGRMASVTAKLWVERSRNWDTKARPMPSTSDAAVQIRNADKLKSVPMIELSTGTSLLLDIG